MNYFSKSALRFLCAGLVAAMVFCDDEPEPTPPPPAATGGDCTGNSSFEVGTGMHDITGPAAELGMMGYASLEQKTTGIHMRLRSRAYVVGSPCNGKRLVFVSADVGQIFQSVKQGVVKKLQQNYGGVYSDANVMLSATHTHSGPGAFSHYALYNLTSLGYDEQNYNAIVDGIYRSIVKAHNNIGLGEVQMNSGDLTDAGFNRSLTAYEANPASERARYTSDTDQLMTVLRMSRGGQDKGMISWFAVHSTNIGNTNRLISGDNKGLASYNFEKWKNTNYGENDTFVAAFANSNEGDVSPNLWGHPDGVNDYSRNTIIADRQYAKAVELYNGANQNLVGGVDFRHKYVDFSDLVIQPEFTDNGQQNTCVAAIGVSMIAGSTEDGVGLDFVDEGLVYDGVSWPQFTLVPEDQACHGEKVILLPMGRFTPFPWTPEILPVQIATVGNLALIAVPFEVTTMAGRRIREAVLAELAGTGVNHAVIVGLANAYAGYVATREEYSVQHYEGASTHFGPYTENALRQEFSKLSDKLAANQSNAPGPTPRDLSNNQTSLQTGVVFDDKPLFKNFGDVVSNPAASYSRGQTAKAVFWGGHPKNNLRIQSTFLKVEFWNGSSWVTARNDWDPDTRYIWKRDGIANSKVTVEWSIPQNAQPGWYRLRHFGNWKSGWTGAISEYSGTSSNFQVN
ncbi:MAG: neutral/alkaline ceramidase [bacterium]|nr:neutral/alkaline ceramidase [bacterium]